MKKNLSVFLGSASVLSLLINTSFASGFMLQEQNAVQTGDFGAGGAAIAEDASTAWFNPAGLVRLTHPQIVAAGNEIWFHTNFTGNITQSIPYQILGQQETISAEQHVNNASGGTNNFVPVFHAAYPINPNLVAAFSVTTPFGLATDYSDATFVRYAATKTDLKTIDLSPSLGMKLNNKFSVGFGLDEQRLIASFDTIAGIPGISHSFPHLFPNFPDNALDTASHNSATDWGMGWHSGVMFQPSNETRFGIAYHSKIVHHATGYSSFTGYLASPDVLQPSANSIYASQTANTTVTLPANTMLSAYHEMNNRWAVMGSVVYTQWDVFKNLTLNNVAALTDIPHEDFPHRALITATVPENFRNTWRMSIGSNYKINNQYLLRAGVGYDQNPTNNTDRNLRLPDGDRYAVALGGRYQANKDLALDAGWTHEFIKSSSINNTSVMGPQTVTVIGNSKSNANILGLQLTYSFA